MDDRELLSTIQHIVGEEETSDDCACFNLGDGRLLVSSTDMLHETTDFPSGMTEYEMGWMSVAVTLSDIASCGAEPIQVLVAVGLDRPERLLPFMEGAAACAKKFGTKISGGDIDSHTEFTVVTTAFGIVSEKEYLHRSGAKVGDLVCITKVPGRAQAALDGHNEFRKYLLTPEPEVAKGKLIAKAGATSMMDVSDGLAISLYDLGKAGSVGFSLDKKLFPLLKFSEETALEYFLYGGGDFGLLFTIPKEKYFSIEKFSTVIGVVTLDQKIFCDEKILEKKGYAHVWK